MPAATNEGIICYVLSMGEKLASIAELAQLNLAKAQTTQKTWHDWTARTRDFKPGHRVLILLPTSTQILRVQRQGPYLIVRKNDKANYVVDVKDKNKRVRTFHVNMLREVE